MKVVLTGLSPNEGDRIADALHSIADLFRECTIETEADDLERLSAKTRARLPTLASEVTE